MQCQRGLETPPFLYRWIQVVVSSHMILRSDQVSSDCIVVDERAHNDVDVPDGVGQGDDPIALEEYHAKLQISHCMGNFLGTKK